MRRPKLDLDKWYEAVEFLGPWEHEEDPQAALDAAAEALKISPYCSEAYHAIASLADLTPEARLDMWRRGLDVAAAVVEANTLFREWSSCAGVSYMRVRFGLAEELSGQGRHDEAAVEYREMLRLDPTQLRTRFSLAACLVHLDLDGELGRLLYADRPADEDDFDVEAIRKPYPDGTELLYAKALHAFRTLGDCERARELLGSASESNPYVPRYLFGDLRSSGPAPSRWKIGSPEEAERYLHASASAWTRTPGAVDWMRETLDMSSPKPGL